jgi:hypothetical protein
MSGIIYSNSEIINSKTQVIVNQINCVAIDTDYYGFKNLYPEMYNFLKTYNPKRINEIWPGNIEYNFWQIPDKDDKWVLNFPLIVLIPGKKVWEPYVDIKWLKEGLYWLRENYKKMGIETITFPALGVTEGLSWDDVKQVYEKYLGDLNMEVIIIPPKGVCKMSNDDNKVKETMVNVETSDVETVNIEKNPSDDRVETIDQAIRRGNELDKEAHKNDDIFKIYKDLGMASLISHLNDLDLEDLKALVIEYKMAPVKNARRWTTPEYAIKVILKYVKSNNGESVVEPSTTPEPSKPSKPTVKLSKPSSVKDVKRNNTFPSKIIRISHHSIDLPSNCNKIEDYDKETIENMALSIGCAGVAIRPVVVEETSSNNYKLIDGLLTYYASIEAEVLDPSTGGWIDAVVFKDKGFEGDYIKDQLVYNKDVFINKTTIDKKDTIDVIKELRPVLDTLTKELAVGSLMMVSDVLTDKKVKESIPKMSRKNAIDKWECILDILEESIVSESKDESSMDSSEKENNKDESIEDSSFESDYIKPATHIVNGDENINPKLKEEGGDAKVYITELYNNAGELVIRSDSNVEVIEALKPRPLAEVLYYEGTNKPHTVSELRKFFEDPIYLLTIKLCEMLNNDKKTILEFSSSLLYDVIEELKKKGK